MHNIFSSYHLHTFSNYAVSLLEDRILPSLTSQQKRILLVASVALSCLAIGYAIYRQCRFKAEVVPEERKRDIEIEVLPPDKKEEDREFTLWLSSLESKDPAEIVAELYDEKSIEIPLKQKLAMAKLAKGALTALNLEDTNVTDLELKEVTYACPNLKTLNLRKCFAITDKAMQYLPKDLEALHMSGCYQLTDEAIKNLRPYLKLETLGLHHCQGLTDAAIKYLPKGLEYLDLSYCHQMTEAAAKNLPPNLKGLTIEPDSPLFRGVTKEPLEATIINADFVRPIVSQDPADLAAQLHDPEQSKTFSLDKKLAMAKHAGALLTSLNLESTTVTDEQLEEVMKACPHLKALNLHKCLKLTEAAMKYLPEDLETLEISHCHQLKDEAIKNLPRGLKTLDLNHCSGLTDAMVENLPKALELIDLSFCKQFTDTAIRGLPQGLKILYLSHCDGITDAAIQGLSRNLERLDLSYCKQITWAAAKDLPPDLTRLMIEPVSRLSLALGKHSLKATVISADYLRSVALEDPTDLAAQLHDPEQSKNLPLDEKLAKAKHAGDALTSLSLAFTRLEDQQLKEVLESCPHLQTLNLTYCHFLSENAIRSLPKNLVSLTLDACEKITDEAIKNLPENLETLSLEECKKFSDEGVKYLPKNLKSLNLSLCDQLTDKALKNLAQHKQLEKLEIRECKFTDAALKDLPANLEVIK